MSSNYVDNIMVYADPFHNYCVALVVPSHQTLEKWAKENGIEYKNISELCDKAEAIKEVQQSLSQVCILSLYTWKRILLFWILKKWVNFFLFVPDSQYSQIQNLTPLATR